MWIRASFAGYKMATIYMAGHSNHTVAEFLALLAKHGVQTLVDVRSFPRSKYTPQFDTEVLAPAAAAAGMRYEHRPQLGGRFAIAEEKLRANLATLPAASERICLMCSEGDFHKCHRHYLLAPLLISAGHQVRQIARDGAAREDAGPAQMEMFA